MMVVNLMQIKYDKEADALYIRLLAGDYQCHVVRLTDDIALDLAAGEQLVGIEVLGASRVFKDPQSPEAELQHLLLQRQIEEGLDSARRGELLDGQAVMQELRERSAALRARGARDIKVTSPGEAPQERKKVAHGASRGRIAKSTKPRQGRKNVLPPPSGATPVAHHGSPTARAVGYSLAP